MPAEVAPQHPDSAPLAEALRAARGDRSIRSVARDVGLSQAHLSRIESGERPAPPALVERLAAALQVDAGPLLERADALPAAVIAALASTDLRLAVGPAELPAATRDALRRIHLAELTERLRARVPGSPRDLVDPRRLLGSLGWATEPSGGAPIEFLPGKRVAIADAGDSARHRFLLAHAVGHIALQGDAPWCSPESASDIELDATAVASFLLVPRAELRNFARDEGKRHDLWDPDGSEFLAAAAVRFAVPVWMVARRLGEDGRLAEIAAVDER
jgi:transcriptional regulator with XRE-family HTH domain